MLRALPPARYGILRLEKRHTLEQVSVGAGVNAKGFLSDFERGDGLSMPHTLMRLATFLGVDLLDMVNAPERGVRNAITELTRHLGQPELNKLLATTQALLAAQKAAADDTE